MTMSARQVGWRLIAPAAHALQALRLPVKLALMGLLLALPLLWLLLITAQRGQQDVQRTRAELQGAQQANALLDVLSALQSHRLHSWQALSGDAAAPAAQATAAQALHAALAQADAAGQGLRYAPPPDWPALREALAALTEPAERPRRDEMAAQHHGLAERLRQQLLAVSERSGLLLDPEAHSFYLMDIAISQAAPWLEGLSELQTGAAALLHRGEANGRERAQQVALARALHERLQDATFRIEALDRAGHAAPAGWATAREATAALAEQTVQTFSAELLQGDADAYRQQAGAALAATLALKQSTVNALSSALQARSQSAQRALWLELGGTGLALLIVGYLMAAFSSSFQHSLHALHRSVREAAAGDLSQPLAVRGRDELAEMGGLLDGMNQRLSSMVAEIRSSAARVGLSGRLVADSSQALAVRTDTQASSLRQTVAAVGQISDAVASNASAAGRLDQLTEQLRGQAEAGGQAMREAVGTMAGLEEGSQRMSEIIGVIDGIAFQTNILALNAAVEAARAGEAGRGFAVVAAEVRQLAQRSATAAGEIRVLIARSTEQVSASVAQTRRIGSTLDEVVEGVRRVSGTLRGIAQASAEQSASLEEMAKSVGSLDEITRENASMVVQSSQASTELVQRAQALSDSVGSIKLRQGSADEAHALVLRALQLVQQRGLGQVADRLRSASEGFVDRDLYVFVIDRQGQYRVHGARPMMEGRRVHEVPGIDGDRFLADAWAAAPAGGWIDYDIVNPE